MTEASAGPPPLREALAAHGLFADKRLGQHFLLDLNLTAKIARLAQLQPDQPVIEVGPGPGGLTRALLDAGARVIAIEKDPRFLPLLGELAATAGGRLAVVHGDALAIDEATLLAGSGWPGAAAVVSNLPYNVGTPLLVKWLVGGFTPTSLTLMFQKEVALRIAASPGTGDYGRLSVLVQALADVERMMTLPARAFTPPPKVDSAVVRVVPHADRRPPALVTALERATAAAFGQRRKMLRSSLRPLGGEALCREAGIDPDTRAETVDVAGFLRLAAVLAGAEGPPHA